MIAAGHILFALGVARGLPCHEHFEVAAKCRSGSTVIAEVGQSLRDQCSSPYMVTIAPEESV